PDLADLDISEASLRRVRNAMFAVSNHRRGTAWRARIADKTMAMSGKTGTSQVRRITEAERRAGVFRNEDLPWNRRDHALFVAFAPHDDPKYAISVVVEHGGGGSKAAAPIARDVMIRALYGADAPLEAWPEAVREEIEQQRRTPPASAEVPGGSDRA
ncbi:MAG: penicillin-binding transpeptidase domain-containing protein, partial [Pseudomonadota bacterium]